MKTSSRGTGRRMAPEARERAIREAAIAVAREDGIAGLTMRTIAARAGVTPALVAHYRPSMDAFVAEVFGAIVSAERVEVFGALDGTTGMRERLAAVVETLLDPRRDDVTLVWVQAWAAGFRNEELAARVRDEMDAWRQGLEAVLAEGAETGEIPPSQIGVSAWLLLAMVDGMNAHSLVGWAPDDRVALARRMLAAALDHR